MLLMKFPTCFQCPLTISPSIQTNSIWLFKFPTPYPRNYSEIQSPLAIMLIKGSTYLHCLSVHWAEQIFAHANLWHLLESCADRSDPDAHPCARPREFALILFSFCLSFSLSSTIHLHQCQSPPSPPPKPLSDWH